MRGTPCASACLRWGSFAADVSLAREAGIFAIGVDHTAVDAVGAEEAARILDGEGVAVSTYLALEDILGAGGTASLDEAAASTRGRGRAQARSGAVVATGPLGDRTVADADAACRDVARSGRPPRSRPGRRPALRTGASADAPLVLRAARSNTGSRSSSACRERPSSSTSGTSGGNATSTPHPRVHRRDRARAGHQHRPRPRWKRSGTTARRCPTAAMCRWPRSFGTLEAAGYRGWYEDETIARIPRDERLAVLVGHRGSGSKPSEGRGAFLIVVIDGQKRISIPHYRAGP